MKDIAWLEWTTPENRELVHELVKRVESEFSRISHGLKWRWYYFYKGREENLDAKFLVLNIGVKKVWVMIKADPARFEDPKASRLAMPKMYANKLSQGKILHQMWRMEN